MKKNMASYDRIVRLFLAAVLFALYYYNLVEGTLGYILLALGIIFVLTSFVGMCPLYTLLGIRSLKTKKDGA